MTNSIDKIVQTLRSQIPTLKPAELQVQLTKGSIELLDCREPDETDLGVINGALCLPKGKVDLQVERFITDKARPVAVYCASGLRSVLVASTLKQLGYESVFNLTGGIEAWKDAGFPIAPRKETKLNRRRYKAQLALSEIGDEGQKKLTEARVLVIGCGGLGSPIALYLAAAGVGHLGLADGDVVDESNLQRQILHTTDRIGLAKVDSAFLTIKGLNPATDLALYKSRVTETNIDAIVPSYDLVIDGCDNFQTRYLVNRACLKHGVPNISGSVFGFQGQVALYCTKNGPCYECVYPEPPTGDLAPNCAEGGVLGAAVGVVGSLVAVEAIKLLIGIEPSFAGHLISYDGIHSEFERLRIRRNRACRACGAPSSITYESFEPGTFCERSPNG